MAIPDLNYTGRIVEFLDSGEVKLALVTRHVKETLQVTDLNGKQRRVSGKQLIVVHADSVESSAFAARANDLKTKITKHTTSVDTELLWESVYENVDDVDLDKLAENYFGDTSAVYRSAVFRAVIGDPARFKFKGRKITPRTPDQVEEQQIALARRRERQEQRARTIEWMATALRRTDDTPLEPCPDGELALPRLERFLTKGVNDGIEQWLDEIRGDRSRMSTALELLIASGRLPPDADLRLVTAGVRIVFSDDASAALGRLKPFTPEKYRRDLRDLTAFSIDDEDTREIDDALTAVDLGDRIQVGIHIADVSHFVSPDDPLDREAFTRGASVYLPYRTVPMFPERLSCDLASLVAEEDRPAMTVLADFRRDGELIESQLCRSQINVSRRLSYDEADALLKTPEDNDTSKAISLLRPIAAQLQHDREARGALTIRRPELKLLVENGEVDLKVLDGTSPSRQIVSELMILTNRLVAEYAAENDVGIIFRAQDAPREPIDLPDGYDPIALDKIFRLLTRSKLSLTPQPHSGLGLNAYTQLTSPLRRYPDLVIQRQLIAHLSGSQPPYEQPQLLAVLGSAYDVEADNRTLENTATREFALRYLEKRRAEFDSEAIVVARLTGGFLVEPSGLPIRGKLLARRDLEVGDRVHVEIEGVDPEGGTVTFRNAETA